jgi:hypothetical protein
MSKSNLEQFHVLALQLQNQYKVVERNVDQIYANKDVAATTETLESIRALLLEVKQTEHQIQPLRDSLQAEGESMPEATQKIIDRTVQIVTTLIPRIGALEKEAIDSKEKLAPVIREGVRAVKMKSAYSKQQH